MLAKAHGIESLYIESSDEHSTFAIDKIAKNKLSMQITPVDTHPRRINNENDISLEERNIFIANNIHKQKRDGIFITGAEHIMGLLSHDPSKIDPNQYHIVPINLTGLYRPLEITNIERSFAVNENMVIQVTQADQCLSSSEQVLAKWNRIEDEENFNRPSKRARIIDEKDERPSKKARLNDEKDERRPPVVFRNMNITTNNKNDTSEPNETNQKGIFERVFNCFKRPW
jgi:hypothetical protein